MRKKNSNTLINRIGTIAINSYGSKMIVEEYNSYDDIWVRFIENGNRVHTKWNNFLKGEVKNVYNRTVFGTGYIGEGEHHCQVNKVKTNVYKFWSRMIERCYSEKSILRHPSYKDCTVAEEWHNFQSFAQWFSVNYYEVNDEKMCLDKDILVKGNKVYSPDTCVIAPQRINNLFVNSFPNSGVCLVTKTNKYLAQCEKGKGNHAYLGTFDTYKEAFNTYKIHKEKLIRRIADEYKGNIPENLYEAMLNYTIEMDKTK